MNERVSETPRDDAPLVAAKAPDDDIHVEHLAVRPGDVLVGRSVTIERPREELYAFWRNFGNLPQFMHNILRVTEIDSTHSRWLVAAAVGNSVEWPSVITADDPGYLIAWESEQGVSIRNSGKVEFKDSSERRGTVVTVTLSYEPPGGTLGQLIAKLFHKEPKIQARRGVTDKFPIGAMMEKGLSVGMKSPKSS